MTSFRAPHWLALIASGAVAACMVACGSTGDGGNGNGDGPNGGFVSDNPDLAESGDDYGDPTDSGGSGGSGGGAGNTGAPDPSDESGRGDAERAIAEADIIQLQGDKLYALSQYGGLSVIDVGTRDELSLLGRYKSQAEPFEMYVRDGVVFGLFNSYGRYVELADGGWEWAESSYVVALDASDPSNIIKLGEFEMPGSISDSRIVGDALYVVGYENGYCWRCDENNPRTTIISLDVSTPKQIAKVDELAFVDNQDEWGWGRRSITVTTDRMYVAGREYSDGDWGSTIQVVDISDPGGDMVPGTTVEAEGEITSRWQMDEHEGVLRVISQPGSWSLDDPPVVQTFSVQNAQSITPLAKLDMVLPRPEMLRSVRFDGTRGYAITFERTDPLFTLDLSDPANPKQLGELEIPGWVYHMEPRGDRILALGFDNTNDEGSLNVSIFDVSDMTKPTMLDRVQFGGDWGNLAEDQDRIHKAFGLLEPLGLILVPFSGYDRSDEASYCGRYQSGVQLIDWNGDDLTKRGVAPSFGRARRAFVHDERLFTVSDDRVQTFDFADRDAPAEKAKLALAKRVSRSAVANGNLVRLGMNWWTESAEVDVVSLADASSPTSRGSLDLENQLKGDGCGYGFYGSRLFAEGDTAYVVYTDYNYSYDYGYSHTEGSAVAVVDVSDPSAPTLKTQHTLDFTANEFYGGYGLNQVVASGDRVVKSGSTMTFLRSDSQWSDGDQRINDAWLEVVDLSDPAEAKTTKLELPDGSGLTGLHGDGNTLYTSHFENVKGSSSKVRFYIDRIDVSDPRAPKLLGKVNVPGSLLARDPSTGKFLTIDYHRKSARTDSYSDCYDKHGYRAHFEPDGQAENDPYGHYYDKPGTCHWVSYSLKLVRIDGSSAVLEDTLTLGADKQPSRTAMGAGRMFLELDRYDYYYDAYGNSSDDNSVPLTVVSGFAEGQLTLAEVKLESDTPWGGYIRELEADGDRAVVATGYNGTVSVIDAADPTKPSVVQSMSVPGYVEDVVCEDGRAYVSLGYDGVEVINMR